MTNNKTTTHVIELVVETPEDYFSVNVAKEVAGECEHVWCSADGERSYLQQWNVVSVKGRRI